MAAAVLLWASFALTLRGVGATTLTTIDLTLLRFLTPLVVLAPWIPRALVQLRGERLRVVLLLLSGGLPHFLLSAAGGHHAPAALVGLLIPGTVPLFVTLLTLVITRARVRGRQLIAVAVIVVGVAVAAAQAASPTMLAGIGVLLTAGFVWAVYTLGLRDTRLGLTSVILVICAPSAAGAAMLALTGAMPSHLLAGAARGQDVLLFLALQGIGTGVVSTFAYAHAVRTLGSGPSATAGALSPVVAALLAVPLLGEPVTAGRAAALALIVLGVVLFTLAPRRSRAGQPTARPTTPRRRGTAGAPATSRREVLIAQATSRP